MTILVKNTETNNTYIIQKHETPRNTLNIPNIIHILKQTESTPKIAKQYKIKPLKRQDIILNTLKQTKNKQQNTKQTNEKH